MDWQAIAAIGVVLLVGLLFIRRWVKRSKGGACGGGCGCPTGTAKRKGGKADIAKTSLP